MNDPNPNSLNNLVNSNLRFLSDWVAREIEFGICNSNRPAEVIRRFLGFTVFCIEIIFIVLLYELETLHNWHTLLGIVGGLQKSINNVTKSAWEDIPIDVINFFLSVLNILRNDNFFLIRRNYLVGQLIL